MSDSGMSVANSKLPLVYTKKERPGTQEGRKPLEKLQVALMGIHFLPIFQRLFPDDYKRKEKEIGDLFSSTRKKKIFPKHWVVVKELVSGVNNESLELKKSIERLRLLFPEEIDIQRLMKLLTPSVGELSKALKRLQRILGPVSLPSHTSV